MNKLDLDYQELLKDILENGVEKTTRNGKVLSVFGRQIRHKMSTGFPILTTKKVSFKNVATELLWFLQGRQDLKYLVDNGCNIWVGDAFKKYNNYQSDNAQHIAEKDFIEKIKNDNSFSERWGNLGKIYGVQWRNWNGGDDKEVANVKGIDQIEILINLLKNDPDSRRMVVNAWNVGDIETNSMVLPPCHFSFQCYTRELTSDERYNLLSKNELDNYYQHIPRRAISLKWTQRSVDTPLGLGFNITSYGLLLEILGKICNMVPDELIGDLGDTHIYLNQIDGCKEQLTNQPFQLPTLKHIKPNEFWQNFNVSQFEELKASDFELINYQSHKQIKIPLSN